MYQSAAAVCAADVAERYSRESPRRRWRRAREAGVLAVADPPGFVHLLPSDGGRHLDRALHRLRVDLPCREGAYHSARGRGRHIEHVAALQRGSTNTTATPSLTCGFPRTRSAPPLARARLALNQVRPHPLIAVDGQSGPLFSQDVVRIVVYERAPFWRTMAMGIIWTIVIGFIAGVIAKFLMPGKNEPAGFILTTILGIVGAIVATYRVRLSAGMGRMKARDLLAQSLEP